MANANLAKKEANNVVVFDASMFEADANDGLQNMSSQDDLALPFLKLLTTTSPELATMDNAKPGFILNTVTNELFDGKEGLEVIPCHYERKYVEWSPRGSGNSAPVAIHPANSDIMSKTRRVAGDSKDYLDNGNYIENTAQHYILYKNKEGLFTMALVVMKSTQLKKSRKWNSMMMSTKMMGKNGPFTPPTYSQIYRLNSVGESNDKGRWFGWEIERVGPVEDMSVYQQAKAFALSINKGEVKTQHMGEENAAAETDAF
jgi:hypothetical protein